MARDFDIRIGTRQTYGGCTVPFGLSVSDLYHHLWPSGQTGVGKSSVMLSIMSQVIEMGHGCTLLDLNGDLSNELPNYIPYSRRSDVIILDPADLDHVLSINPIYNIPTDNVTVFAEQFTDTCQNIWRNGWGDRMDWILGNTVKAASFAHPDCRATIRAIPLILTNKHYRKELLKTVSDQATLDFFHTEFDRYTDRERSAFIMPIENKIGKIVSNPYIANLLSRYQPAYQLRDAIPNKHILIIRLAKGTMGKKAAQLVGSLALAEILNAAQAQDPLPEDERTPHFLFIDELHNLPPTSLPHAFDEFRHYKFGIIPTTQYSEQLDEELLASMFGNVGTTLAFRSGKTDALMFEKHIGEFPAEQYTQLNRGEVRVRLLRDNEAVPPFKGHTTIDHLHPHNYGKQIRTLSLQTHTSPREEIEEEYRRWHRKQTTSPNERKEQHFETMERRKLRIVRKYETIAPLLAPATISARGRKARENIRAIAAGVLHQNAVSKKPTRRRNRRSKTDGVV